MDHTQSPHANPQSAAEAALQPLLDAFARKDRTEQELATGLTDICAQHPGATWQALSLLDQYHRRRVLPIELFNALKKDLNAIAFGSAGAHVTADGQTISRLATSHTVSRTVRTAQFARAQPTPDSADITARFGRKTDRDPDSTSRRDAPVHYLPSKDPALRRRDDATSRRVSPDNTPSTPPVAQPLLETSADYIPSDALDDNASADFQADITAARLSDSTLPRSMRTAAPSEQIQEQLEEPVEPYFEAPPAATIEPLVETLYRPQNEPRFEPQYQAQAAPQLDHPDPFIRSLAQRAGTVLNGRYILIEPIVNGNVSVVFKALDKQRAALPEGERYVAVKCPHDNVQNDPRTVSAFRFEYAQSQSISHPNIARVFDFSATNDTCFIVMELLQGESLDRILERIAPRRLPTSRALAIVREIGVALAHAHDRGVIHGNLHAGNITIMRNGELRVADFGQAKGWQAPRAASTPAPDSTQGPQPADDLYNLARIAHELLCGCNPEYAAINLGRKERPAYAKHLSAQQWRALQRALADSRLQRVTKVREWLADLDLRTAEIRLPELAVLETETARDPRNKRIAAIAAGAVGVALLVLGGVAIKSTLFSPSSSAVATNSQSIAEPPATTIDSSADSTEPQTDPTPLASYTERLSNAQVGNQETSQADQAPESATDNAPTPTDEVASRMESIGSQLPYVSFTANRYEVPERQPAARLVIQRTAPTNRDLVLRWYTIPDSAQREIDYVSNERATVRIPAGKQYAEVFIPIVRGQRRDRALSFDVRISATSDALPGRPVSTKVVLLPAMTSSPTVETKP